MVYPLLSFNNSFHKRSGNKQHEKRVSHSIHRSHYFYFLRILFYLFYINFVIFTFLHSYYCLVLAEHVHLSPTAAGWGCDAECQGRGQVTGPLPVPWPGPHLAEQDRRYYWTWHKELPDEADRRVTNLQTVLWGIHGRLRRIYMRNGQISQKAQGEHWGCFGEWGSARPTVLGNHISLPMQGRDHLKNGIRNTKIQIQHV